MLNKTINIFFKKLQRISCWFRHKKAFQVVSYSLDKPLVIHFSSQWQCPFQVIRNCTDTYFPHVLPSRCTWKIYLRTGISEFKYLLKGRDGEYSISYPIYLLFNLFHNHLNSFLANRYEYSSGRSSNSSVVGSKNRRSNIIQRPYRQSAIVEMILCPIDISA